MKEIGSVHPQSGDTLGYDSNRRQKYLDPNDCAVSKYARSEPKDREWIRAGIEAGILSLPTIEYRMRETRFMDGAEHALAKTSVAQDKLWFQTLRGTGAAF